MNANVNALDAFLNHNSYGNNFNNSPEGADASEVTDFNPKSPSESTESTHINGNDQNGPMASSWRSDSGETTYLNSAKSAAKGDISWKKVTQGGITGIVLGSAAALLWPDKAEVDVDPEFDGELVLEVHPEPDDASVPATEHHESPLADLVDSDIQWAHNVNDRMSYSEAFAAARSEVGPGGVFQWRGQLYGTYYGDEWDSMSAAERAEFNGHFAWTHGSGDEAPAVDGTDDGIDIIPGREVAEAEPVVTTDGVRTPAFQAPSEASVVDDEIDILSVESEEEGIEVDTADESEVEILGTYHDDETGIIHGGMSIAGQDFLLIDVEDDGKLDYVPSDLNTDDEIAEDEILPLTEEVVEVSDDDPIWDDDYDYNVQEDLYSLGDDFEGDDLFDDGLI